MEVLEVRPGAMPLAFNEHGGLNLRQTPPRICVSLPFSSGRPLHREDDHPVLLMSACPTPKEGTVPLAHTSTHPRHARKRHCYSTSSGLVTTTRGEKKGGW